MTRAGVGGMSAFLAACDSASLRRYDSGLLIVGRSVWLRQNVSADLSHRTADLSGYKRSDLYDSAST